MADYRSCHSINRVPFIAYIVNPQKINKLNLPEKGFAIIEKRYPKYFETPFHSRKKIQAWKGCGIGIACVIKGRCISMKVINSTEPFEPNIEVWEEGVNPLPKKETQERYSDIYDEPMYFFKGTVISFFFCLPFWTILLWLIT
jgi:hypothetical protein